MPLCVRGGGSELREARKGCAGRAGPTGCLWTTHVVLLSSLFSFTSGRAACSTDKKLVQHHPSNNMPNEVPHANGHSVLEDFRHPMDVEEVNSARTGPECTFSVKQG